MTDTQPTDDSNGPRRVAPASATENASSEDTLTHLSTRDPAVANVVESLRSSGINARAQVLPDSTRTAAHAAKALGCEIGAIANSLLFMADGRPLLVMTSGAHRVDLDLLAADLGRTKIRRAEPDEVLYATGQPVGGVSPVGHPTPIETLIDSTLGSYPTIWAAAGTPNAVFNTTFADLLTATGGRVVRVN